MPDSAERITEHTEDALMEVDSNYEDEEDGHENGEGEENGAEAENDDDDDDDDDDEDGSADEGDYCSSSGRESSAPLRRQPLQRSAAAQPQLEVDSNSEVDDCDAWSHSGGSSSLDSETTSIGSAAFEYEYENGRRYHGFRAGQYALPNDEAEQDRLDMMHHIYSLMLGGKLHLAPLRKPRHILDVGTGTGIWAIDMAELYPEASIIGTDLSPIQPGWVPPNVQFFVDDAESDWTFDGEFDFVHIRGMLGSTEDWPRLIEQVFTALKPGGYIEIFECPTFNIASDDDSYHNKTKLWRFYDLANKASKMAGRPLTMAGDPLEFLTDAGFVDLSDDVVKLPLGTWPVDKKMKELGHWMTLMIQTGFEAYGLGLLTRFLGMSPADAKQLFQDCENEVKSKSVHGYFDMHVMVARKPRLEGQSDEEEEEEEELEWIEEGEEGEEWVDEAESKENTVLRAKSGQEEAEEAEEAAETDAASPSSKGTAEAIVQSPEPEKMEEEPVAAAPAAAVGGGAGEKVVG